MKSIAGAGKTTQLKKSLELYRGKKVLVIMFNKSLEEEAKELEKVFSGLSATTYHGFAHRAITSQIGDFEPVEKYLPGHFMERFEFISSFSSAKKIIKLLTDFCHSKKTLPQFVGWAVRNKKYRGILGGISAEKIRQLKVVWPALCREKFLNHDAYSKLFQLQKPFLQYDVIMVDEFQDFSESMVDVVELQDSHAEIILAGDFNQRIYEWRGACGWFNLKFDDVMELHKSWRCPQKVLDIANPYTRFLSDVNMTSMKESEGQTTIYRDEVNAIENLPMEDVTILTRTNTYAFAMAEKMSELGFSIQMNSVVDVRGIEEHWKWLNGYQVDGYLNEWYGEDINDLKSYYWESSQEEKVQELNCALEIENLPKLFQSFATEDQDSRPVANFSTVYRSKGLGFNNVFIASDFTSPYEIPERSNVLTDEDLKLIYVAITRSKEKLYINDKYVSKTPVLEVNPEFNYIERFESEPILEKTIRQEEARRLSRST